MADTTGQFDEELDSRVSPKLREDLGFLFGSRLSVPGEVDRAVMDQANKHFVRRARRRPWPRWAAAAGAAAAVIMCAVLLQTMFSGVSEHKRKSDRPVSALVAARAGPAADIDQNGRVDILDAFRLAKHIASAKQTEAGWDFNSDGLVNRDDVDVVAFTAVRLDKGV